MFKKLLLLMMVTGMSAAPLRGDELLFDATGDVRIASIMRNPATGVDAYNQANLKFAGALNLEKDLNIPAIAHSFGCQTQMGESFLAETLKRPISPNDQSGTLQNRAKFIQKLIEDKELKALVEEQVKILYQAEKGVSELFSDNFIGRVCPELQELQKLKITNPWIYQIQSSINESFLLQTGTLALNVTGIATYTGLIGLMGWLKFKAPYLLDISTAKFGFMMGYFGLIDGMLIYNLCHNYTTAREKRDLMHNLNRIVVTADKLEKIYQDYDLHPQFRVSQIRDEEGLKLLKMLRHSRYRYKHLRMFYYPKVHSFMYQLYQQDQHLAKVFACVAELDACNAIADTIIASKRKGANPFCFVKYSKSAAPLIKTKKFWNVLVSNAVTNDFNEQRQVILTGPNAGGKTTAIRAILQNIVLAQTFGIAAASEFEFTQFDVIDSYLNISDDLINGSSLFVSEVNRAKEVLGRIESLKPNQKYFFALDELFTGTNDQDGQECAYQFVEKIAKYKGVMFIYATHFEKLKTLADELQFCANYQVGAPEKQKDGKLKYPFTFIPGASSSRVAQDIAKQAGLFA